MDTLDRGNAAVLRGHYVGMLSTKEANGVCLGFFEYDTTRDRTTAAQWRDRRILGFDMPSPLYIVPSVQKERYFSKCPIRELPL